MKKKKKSNPWVERKDWLLMIGVVLLTVGQYGRYDKIAYTGMLLMLACIYLKFQEKIE